MQEFKKTNFNDPRNILPLSFAEIHVAVFAKSCKQTNQATNRQAWKCNFLSGGNKSFQTQQY